MLLRQRMLWNQSRGETLNRDYEISCNARNSVKFKYFLHFYFSSSNTVSPLMNVSFVVACSGLTGMADKWLLSIAPNISLWQAICTSEHSEKLPRSGKEPSRNLPRSFGGTFYRTFNGSWLRTNLSDVRFWNSAVWYHY